MTVVSLLMQRVEQDCWSLGTAMRMSIQGMLVMETLQRSNTLQTDGQDKKPMGKVESDDRMLVLMMYRNKVTRACLESLVP